MQRLVFLYALISFPLLAMEPHCDLIAKNIGTIKKTEMDTCWKSCQSNDSCDGAVFISGWNRCFLKNEIKRKSSIKFFSEIKGKEASYDRDFTGKDLKKHVVDDVSKCRLKCDDEARCTGFTYIEGYRDCWIKHTAGRLIPKIFSCRVKEKKRKG